MTLARAVKVSVPFYITTTALVKLSVSESEIFMTRAARTRGIIQMIPDLRFPLV